MINYFCQSTTTKRQVLTWGNTYFHLNLAKQVSKVIMTKLMEWCWFREVRVCGSQLPEVRTPMAQHGADTDTGPHIMRVLTSSPCPIITHHTVTVFYYQDLSLDRSSQGKLTLFITLTVQVQAFPCG